jgi:hypothetical protein
MTDPKQEDSDTVIAIARGLIAKHGSSGALHLMMVATIYTAAHHCKGDLARAEEMLHALVGVTQESGVPPDLNASGYVH